VTVIILDMSPEAMVTSPEREVSPVFSPQVTVIVTISSEPLPASGLTLIHPSPDDAVQPAALMKVTGLLPESSPRLMPDGPMMLMAGSGTSGPGSGTGSGLHCHRSIQTASKKKNSSFFITYKNTIFFGKHTLHFQIRKYLIIRAFCGLKHGGWQRIFVQKRLV
jgi:hypothetical protein